MKLIVAIFAIIEYIACLLIAAKKVFSSNVLYFMDHYIGLHVVPLLVI